MKLYHILGWIKMDKKNFVIETANLSIHFAHRGSQNGA